MTTTLETFGTVSLSSSSHLPPSEASYTAKPVALPPGRAKLATKPLPTGSATVAKTMGTLRVCCSSVAVVGVSFERIRSGCSAISSFAYRRTSPRQTRPSELRSEYFGRPPIRAFEVPPGIPPRRLDIPSRSRLQPSRYRGAASGRLAAHVQRAATARPS